MAVDQSMTKASEALETRIRAHRAKMARRSDRRDPARELGALLREQIGLAALEATYAEHRQNKAAWIDEEDAPVDGG